MVKSETDPTETGTEAGSDPVLPPSNDEGTATVEDKTTAVSTTMQLTEKMAAAATATSTTAGTAPQNLHHSPGSASTSSSSSSSSSNTGYTRQTNPRPRAHKHSTGSTTSGTTSTAPPILSSLPPSALTAAPYIPTSMVHQPVEYHHGGHNHPPPLHHIHHMHHPVHVAPSYGYMQGAVTPCQDGGLPHTSGPPPPG